MVRSNVLTDGEISPTDTTCRFNGRLKLHNGHNFFATVRAYRLKEFC